MKHPSGLESSYDRVARHYAAEYFDELFEYPTRRMYALANKAVSSKR